MTTIIKEQLTKVVNDLIANRGRLADAQSGLQLQIDQNTLQLAHFDTLIAAVKVVITDEDNLESTAAGITDVNLNLPIDTAPPAGGDSPLPPAGGDTQSPAPAPADGSTGTDGNGSPVTGNTVAAG